MWVRKEQMNTTVLKKKNVIVIGICMLILVLLYSATFRWLLNQWMTDRVYSYGFIVPFISLYLVWVKRKQLSSLIPIPSCFIGYLVLLTSGVFLLCGRVGAIVQLEALSLLLFPVGIVLVLWGRAYLKVLFIPLAYLQFMVPWMDDIFNRVHIYFQLLSSVMGGWILQFLGFSVYRDGIYLQLSSITLEVAPECSGVNFFVSVLAIGVPLVYLTQRTWWRGAGVLLSGLLITLVSNWVRVALAGVMGYYYGSEMLHGPGHIFRGMLVAQVGWIELFLVNWLVCKIPSQVKHRLYENRQPSIELTHEYSVRSATTKSMTTLLMLIVAFGIYLNLFAMPQPVTGMLHIDALPYTVGKWQGYDSKWISGKAYYPGVDVELTRTYRGSSGDDIYLYVGYMNYQSADKRLVSYHSRPFYRNSKELETGLYLPLPHIVNSSVQNIQDRRLSTFLWYRLPSENIAGRLEMKLKSMMNALLYRSNNGAVIIVAKKEGAGAATTTIPKDVKEFVEAIIPKLYSQPL